MSRRIVPLMAVAALTLTGCSPSDVPAEPKAPRVVAVKPATPTSPAPAETDEDAPPVSEPAEKPPAQTAPSPTAPAASVEPSPAPAPRSTECDGAFAVTKAEPISTALGREFTVGDPLCAVLDGEFISLHLLEGEGPGEHLIDIAFDPASHDPFEALIAFELETLE